MSPANRPENSRGLFDLSLLASQFPALHGMRVLAIVLVVQFHLTFALLAGNVPLDGAFAVLSASAFFGMDLFFILSGFLIGSIILQSLESSSGHNVWRFYVRRTFRIFPLYYVSLAALVLVHPPNAVQRHNLVFECLYLTNYLHVARETVMMMWGWSLCVEEHFYLAAPLLLGGLYLLRTHGLRIGFLLALWASALVIKLVIFNAHAGAWDDSSLFRAFYLRTHTRFDTLVAGIVIAYVQHHFAPQMRALLAARPARIAALSLSFACFVVVMFPHRFPNFFLVRMISWGTLTSVMYTPLIFLAIDADGRIQRFLSARFFLRLATLGYGIYLWHVPLCETVLVPIARMFVRQLGISMVLLWPITLAALIALSAVGAYLTHVLVEKPALWIRDRLAP